MHQSACSDGRKDALRTVPFEQRFEESLRALPKAYFNFGPETARQGFLWLLPLGTTWPWNQNTNFKANWICRDGVTVVEITPQVGEMLGAPVALTPVKAVNPLGTPKFG